MSDDLLKLIHSDVKDIKKDISDLKVTSGKQQVSLEEHMKRSDALQELIQHIDESKVIPLEKDMNQIKGIYKFLAALATLATILLTIIEYFKK